MPPPENTDSTTLPFASNVKSMVFQNLDIMEMIFQEYETPQDRHLLLQAALTSKNFFNPAMNILWRSLESLIPILQLIPSLERFVIDDEQDTDYYTTIKPISEEDLRGVDRYSRRVRYLTMSSLPDKHEPRIASHIVFSLNKLRQFRLFPSLKSVTIENLDNKYVMPDNLQSLVLVPSPNISQVNFTGINPMSEVYITTFLTLLLGMKTQSLSVLNLEGILTSDFIDIVSRFVKLEYLRLGLEQMPVPLSKVLEILFQLPDIRGLTLQYCNDKSADLWGQSSGVLPQKTPRRENFRRLELHGNVRQTCTILNLVGKYMPILEKLYLFFFTYEEDEGLGYHRLLDQCLANAVAQHTLVTKCIADAVGEGSIHWRALQHITSWKSLAHLEISVSRAVIDDDSAIDPLGLSWPLRDLDALEVLVFCVVEWVQNGRVLPSANISLRCLPQIAKCYPKLDQLEIYIPPKLLTSEDVLASVKRDLDDGRRDPPASPHGLQNLTFFRLHRLKNPGNMKQGVRDAITIAEYLLLVFPELDYLEFDTDSPGEEAPTAPMPRDDWCQAVIDIWSSIKRRDGQRVNTSESEDTEEVGSERGE